VRVYVCALNGVERTCTRAWRLDLLASVVCLTAPHSLMQHSWAALIHRCASACVYACASITCASVASDAVLFNDTILHNVRYGRLDATFEEVEAAVEVCSCAVPHHLMHARGMARVV
jgi:hypothetical protein